VASLAISFGSGAMTNSIADIEQAEVIFMIGSNPDTSHPTIGLRLHQAVDKGAKLVVVDPRKTDFAARADDMIVSAGYNIAGPEVEAALLQHSDVAECAVVGAPDTERGQIVAAYVVLKPGVTGDAPCIKRLQDHVKAVIAPYKYPRSISFIDVLPKTQTGKIQRFKLREQS